MRKEKNRQIVNPHSRKTIAGILEENGSYAVVNKGQIPFTLLNARDKGPFSHSLRKASHARYRGKHPVSPDN